MDEIALVKETTQYIKIKMGDEMYGIDIKYIDNVVRMQHITRVPKVPFALHDGEVFAEYCQKTLGNMFYYHIILI